MYRPRLIPVLLLHKGGLVKSTNFKNYKYIGDPINAVKIFNDLKADELVFLDIDATKFRRSINIDLVKEIGEEADMPFSVGGGINSLSQIKSLIQAGSERVIIGHEAIANPRFVREAADAFGTSTISVCIDVKKNMLGKEFVWSCNGTINHKTNPVDFAKQMEESGAGEIVIQSITKDGSMSGFDLNLVKRVSDAITISVVALGGAGNLDHCEELFDYIPVSGIASGSKFVYQSEMRGVLINYPSIMERRKF